MVLKRVRELSGLDIGKVASISPQPGMRITDEILTVLHGQGLNGLPDPGHVMVKFKNVAPLRVLDIGPSAFRFDGSDMVEVND